MPVFDKYMEASVAAVIEYAHKRAMEEYDGDIENYFIAFDYHCKDIVKRIMKGGTYEAIYIKIHRRKLEKTSGLQPGCHCNDER